MNDPSRYNVVPGPPPTRTRFKPTNYQVSDYARGIRNPTESLNSGRPGPSGLEAIPDEAEYNEEAWNQFEMQQLKTGTKTPPRDGPKLLQRTERQFTVKFDGNYPVHKNVYVEPHKQGTNHGGIPVKYLPWEKKPSTFHRTQGKDLCHDELGLPYLKDKETVRGRSGTDSSVPTVYSEDSQQTLWDPKVNGPLNNITNGQEITKKVSYGEYIQLPERAVLYDNILPAKPKADSGEYMRAAHPEFYYGPSKAPLNSASYYTNYDLDHSKDPFHHGSAYWARKRLEDLTKVKPETPKHNVQNPPPNLVEHICLVDPKDCQFHRDPEPGWSVQEIRNWEMATGRTAPPLKFNPYTNSNGRFHEYVVRAKDQGRQCWYKATQIWYVSTEKLKKSAESTLQDLRKLPKRVAHLPGSLREDFLEWRKERNLGRKERTYQRHAAFYTLEKFVMAPIIPIKEMYTKLRKKAMKETTSKHGNSNGPSNSGK